MILDRSLNAAVMHIASRLFPTGYDVTASEITSLEQVRENVDRTGRMLVSSLYCEHTIFGDVEVNCAFRAWHDWCHLAGNFAFTLEGETEATAMQLDHLRTLYGDRAQAWAPILEAEIIGQARYDARHGRFPTDQVAFDLAYLACPETALARGDW